MAKTRINISIDQDLADFIKNFAGENRTSVADIITQDVLTLKRNVDGELPFRLPFSVAFGLCWPFWSENGE